MVGDVSAGWIDLAADECCRRPAVDAVELEKGQSGGKRAVVRLAGQFVGEHVLNRSRPHPVVEIAQHNGRQFGLLCEHRHLAALASPLDEP